MNRFCRWWGAALIVVVGLLAVSPQANAAMSLNLVFDNNNLSVGNTGTFSISGATTSSSGSSVYWVTQSSNGPTDLMTTSGQLLFNVLSVTNAPTLTYNGNTVTQSMTGSNFLTFSGAGGMPNNAAYIDGPNTASSTNALFKIGNGTTDAITGTFQITSSTGLGSLTLQDLNTTFGDDASHQPNVNLSASAAPEPASLALLLLGGVALVGPRRGKSRERHC